MKRRILLVDDEVAVLLTMKAVLEISGFDVETAASAREAKAKIRARQYHMIITDMRMENDAAGAEVIQAARTAPYHPAVALLTAFPDNEEDWNGVGPDKILVKATHTRLLLQAIERLFATHSAKLGKLSQQTAGKIAAPESPAVSSAAETRTPKRTSGGSKTSPPDEKISLYASGQNGSSAAPGAVNSTPTKPERSSKKKATKQTVNGRPRRTQTATRRARSAKGKPPSA